MLVPEAETAGMFDTDLKDSPHLAAAHAAGAHLLITDNIKDFGADDLDRLSMSAVTPDLFLSTRLDEHSYVEVLETLAKGRSREPRTAEGIHGQEVAPRLPLLARTFASSFDVPRDPPAQNPMTEIFRGCRCVRCEEILDQSDDQLCETCRSPIGEAEPVP